MKIRTDYWQQVLIGGIVLACCCLIPSLGFAQLNIWGPYRNDSNSTEIGGRVLSEVRSPDHDVLFLTNGDRLHGKLKNERLTLRTPYTRLELDTAKLAALSWRNEPLGRAAVISVLGDRFSGVLEEDSLEFELAHGVTVQFTREQVVKVIFQTRPKETAGVNPKWVFLLGNTDSFSGQFVTDTIALQTSYASIPLALDQLRTAWIPGRCDRESWVELRNQESIRGAFAPRQFEVELDLGGRIVVDTATAGFTKIQLVEMPQPRRRKR
ncbi:MAG: hypothetical protein ACKOUR_07485 [Planctomycetota bacterium]